MLCNSCIVWIWVCLSGPSRWGKHSALDTVHVSYLVLDFAFTCIAFAFPIPQKALVRLVPTPIQLMSLPLVNGQAMDTAQEI